MSNHSGSYMLNSILTMLDEEYDFLKDRTPQEVRNIFNKFDEIGSLYDNSSWFSSSEFIVTHKPTGYTTSSYNRKSDAFNEVQMFLNNEFIHKY